MQHTLSIYLSTYLSIYLSTYTYAERLHHASISVIQSVTVHDHVAAESVGLEANPHFCAAAGDDYRVAPLQHLYVCM